MLIMRLTVHIGLVSNSIMPIHSTVIEANTFQPTAHATTEDTKTTKTTTQCNMMPIADAPDNCCGQQQVTTLYKALRDNQLPKTLNRIIKSPHKGNPTGSKTGVNHPPRTA